MGRRLSHRPRSGTKREFWTLVRVVKVDTSGSRWELVYLHQDIYAETNLSHPGSRRPRSRTHAKELAHCRGRCVCSGWSGQHCSRSSFVRRRCLSESDLERFLVPVPAMSDSAGPGQAECLPRVVFQAQAPGCFGASGVLSLHLRTVCYLVGPNCFVAFLTQSDLEVHHRPRGCLTQRGDVECLWAFV